MKQNSASKIKLTSYEDLIGGEVSKDETKYIDIRMLHEFKNHPFRVLDNEEMDELVESISKNGIVTPILVRPDKKIGYEIISGHRRKHAAELVGLEKVPVLIRDLSDSDAVVLMADSNLQRENILPSEKAHAYRMKADALKHPGIKGTDTAATVGSEEGKSGRQIQRYIRLTYLTPILLGYVDDGKLSMLSGVEISRLKLQEQVWVETICGESKQFPTVQRAKQIRQYSEEKKLTFELTQLFILGEQVAKRKITLSEKRINIFFQKNMIPNK